MLAFKALPQLDGLHRFGPWLYSTTCRRALRYLKEETWFEPSYDLDAVILKHTRAIALDPAQILEHQHKNDEMREASGQLPPEYQVVLRLYYWDDRPQQNIGDLLVVPLTTVKWRLYKAKQMLKRTFAKTSKRGEVTMHIEQEQQPISETQRICRVLESTARLAKEASLSGAFEGGEQRCIRQFDSGLSRLIEIGEVPEGIFEPLKENTSFGEAAVACVQLTAYLDDGSHDVHNDREGRWRERHRRPDRGQVLTNIETDLKDLGEMIEGELKDFGQVVRQSMPDFVKGAWKQSQKDKTSDAWEEIKVSDSQEQQIAELGRQMQAAADRLRGEALSPEETQRVGDEMHELGERQTQFAQQLARLRVHPRPDNPKIDEQN